MHHQPLRRVLQTQLLQVLHLRRAVRILPNRQRHRPVLERQQLRALGGVRGPMERPVAVRVERAREADEVVRHVPAAIHVGELRAVRLQRSEASAQVVTCE